ncbi:MAG: ABC transporter ATP-binding protein [Acutalibacteraceae bacterium]
MGYLRTENISKSFGEKKVIDEISIHLDEGEIVCLLGVSGSGKTTLFNVISGLYKPDGGKIFLSDKDITGEPGKISYMLQKDLLQPYYTVLDNVCLPLIIKKGMKKKEARETASPLFAQFGLDGTQKKYPAQLSGGMKQRAALLRTYLSSDGVALLDEPFSALDTITKSSIHEWYLNIMQEIKLSTLFVTHDIDEAILLSDRIYILSGSPGKITAEFKISEKKPRDNSFTMTNEFIAYKRKIIEELGEI